MDMGKLKASKEREHVLVKSVFILVIFFIIGVLVTYPLSREERFLPLSIMVVLGVLAAGIYVMPKLARNYEEVLWGCLAVSMLFLLFVGVVLSVFLWERRIIQGESSAVLVILGLFFPLSLLVGATVYEILDQRRANRTLTFRLKRLAGRMSFVMVFLAIFLAFVGLLSAISQTINVTTPALVLSSLTTAIIFFLLARKPKTRELLGKLEKGEW